MTPPRRLAADFSNPRFHGIELVGSATFSTFLRNMPATGLRSAPFTIGPGSMLNSSIQNQTGTRETHIPKIGFCYEKNRLLGEFLRAIREVTELQRQQTQAVIDAVAEVDVDFMRFDLLLHLAQDRKDRAKYAWIAHVEEHGCQEGSI